MSAPAFCQVPFSEGQGWGRIRDGERLFEEILASMI